MSTVNDLMKYLNEKFPASFNLPTLATRWLTPFMKTLWKATIKNWSGDADPPTEVTVETPSDLSLDLGGAKLAFSNVIIKITLPKQRREPHHDNPQPTPTNRRAS